MKLLKNRGVAIIITIVVVIASTLFGIYTSANRVAREIESTFYDGVFLEDENRLQPSLNSHLQNAENAALGLGTILGNYPELADNANALLMAQDKLASAMSISSRESAAWELRDSFAELMKSAELVSLDERDTAATEHHASTFRGAFSAMHNTHYNIAAEERLSGQSPIFRIVSDFLSANRPDFFRVPNISQ